MSAIEISVAVGATDDQKAAIIGGLVSYNDSRASPEGHLPLAVVARTGGMLIGGLLGYTHWNWLFIQQLWVAESARGNGTGCRLMLTAEGEAVARGCRHAHCDTFAFQALPFYQKLGYAVFGQLEDFPPGHTRYFLQKRNLHASAGENAN